MVFVFFWEDVLLSSQGNEFYRLNHEWGPCSHRSSFENFSLCHWREPLPPLETDFSSCRNTQQIPLEYLGNQSMRKKYWVKLYGRKRLLLLTYKYLCLYDAKYIYPLLHLQLLSWEFNISLFLNTASKKSALTACTFTCMLVWNY